MKTRLVIFLGVLLIAVALNGCGGGSGTTATTAIYSIDDCTQACDGKYGDEFKDCMDDCKQCKYKTCLGSRGNELSYCVASCMDEN